MKIACRILLIGLIFHTGTAMQAASLSDGLIGYYPFNGNVNDESGNGHHGQVYDPTGSIQPAADRFGAANSAYAFTTFAEAAIWGNGIALAGKSLTVSFWIKTAYSPALDDFGGVWVGPVQPGAPNPGGSTGNNLHFYSADEIIRWSFFSDDCDSAQMSTSAQWAQLCATFNRTNMSRSIFLNGLPIKNCGAAYGYSGTDLFVITGRRGAIMDDVRFYNRALSPTEVESLYRLEAESPVCTPHAARATATLVNGFVVGATITDPGCGYTNAPTVLIQGGGGSGATATATITNGKVTAINMTAAGCCYDEPPLILIGSPPFVPTVVVTVSKLKVTQNVILGRSYVLESSPDLKTWADVGPPFRAETETVVSQVQPTGSEIYFRMREAP